VFAIISGSLYFWSDNLTDLLVKGDRRVVLVMKTTERISEFWIILEKGAIQAGEDLGISVEVTGPDLEENIEQQIYLMDEIIASDPDAIILAATDYYRLVPVAEKAVDEGIPLLMVDSFIDSTESQCNIGTDNIAAGRKLGRYMKTFLHPGDEVAVISFVRDSSSAIDREKGFLAEIGNLYSVYDTIYTNNNIETGYQATLNMLEKYPEIRGLVALNENSALGTYRALKDSGLQDRIVFMTFDSDLELIHGLEEEIIDATLVQKPYNMGYLSVKNAFSLIEGKTVHRNIDTGSELITKQNMYNIRNQKLLFPSH
jgi:ribose transport system substrate-binding protein